MTHPTPIYGLLAEFKDPAALVAATARVHQAGYHKFEAYSPYPIEAVAEAMHFHDVRVPLGVLGGGIVGAISGYAMQVYALFVTYPMNVAGKPMHSWPMNIPITFEMTILLAAFGAVFGMLAMNGLPMPYHPLFNVEAFKRASQDGFFLCIEAADPKFDRAATIRFLESLSPVEVHEVAH
jgi:hypothetical protein